MKMKRIYFFIGILAILVAISSCSQDTQEAPEEPTSPQKEMLKTADAEHISSIYQGDENALPQRSTLNAYPCSGDETVALIQDVVPWGGNSNVEELSAQGIDFCIINSSDLGTADLSKYKVIIISSDQTQTFYNNLFPAGSIHSAIDAFVKGGGILSANLCDYGWNFGLWVNYKFIADVQHVISLTDNNNIAAPSHPIITGEYGGTNGGQILDDGNKNDLDGWSASSHGYFTDLPVGTEVILKDGYNQPVMVEYTYGKGVIIASLTTTEFRYYFYYPDYVDKKLLANDIGYQMALAIKKVEFDIKPGSCTNPLNTASNGVLPVAILGTEDFDVNTIDMTTIKLEGVDFLRYALEDVSTPVLDRQDECDCTTEGPDGFMDLTLKFDTQAIIAALGEINDGDVITLTITGNLLDEKPFIGKDCVIILKKKKE